MNNETGNSKKKTGTEKPLLLLRKLKKITGGAAAVQSHRYPEKDKNSCHIFPFLRLLFEKHSSFGREITISISHETSGIKYKIPASGIVRTLGKKRSCLWFNHKQERLYSENKGCSYSTIRS